MKKLRFIKNKVFLNSHSLELNYIIEQAYLTDYKVIVLFAPDAIESESGQFHNLIALDTKGNKLWVAELPTNESGDCYFEINFNEKLTAYSWKSFECEIDINTGKILNKVFYK